MLKFRRTRMLPWSKLVTAVRRHGKLGRPLVVGITMVFVAWATLWPPGLLSVAADAQTENESIRFLLQVREIEAYLNNIKTVHARFRQVSSTGDVAEGDLYIQRPGRIRVEYDPPSPLLIVSDGLFLIFYDRQLKQVTHLPLSSTPANVLTRDNIALRGGDIRITRFEQDEETLRLTLVLRADPMAGIITLVFSRKPVRLTMWSITDAQGVVIEVTLIQASFNQQLEEDLFEFRE